MKLHYYKSTQLRNFGDDLNEWLWPRLMPELLDDDDSAILLGIGTILNDILNETIPAGCQRIAVLSSGVGYGSGRPRIDGRWKINCLRGPGGGGGGGREREGGERGGGGGGGGGGKGGGGGGGGGEKGRGERGGGGGQARSLSAGKSLQAPELLAVTDGAALLRRVYLPPDMQELAILLHAARAAVGIRQGASGRGFATTLISATSTPGGRSARS